MMDELIERLEQLVDESSIEDVITSLADVCYNKEQKWKGKLVSEHYKRIRSRLLKIDLNYKSQISFQQNGG